MISVWILVLASLVQSLLYFELGLLFLKILSQHSSGILAQLFSWLAQILGYCFLLFACYELVILMLQLFSIW